MTCRSSRVKSSGERLIIGLFCRMKPLINDGIARLRPILVRYRLTAPWKSASGGLHRSLQQGRGTD